jgi:LAGLIDADG endonuclease
MTLDTRKIPPTIGNYLAGFTDGEGSFNLSFRKRKDYSMPWKISLCFNVSQRDKVVLTLFKKHLRCGTLRMREDGVWYYEVNNFTAITENVIPFFDRFGFLSAKKKRDFAKFKKLAELISMGAHLGNEGIQKILEIRRTMNDGGVGKRKYSEQDIMSNMELGKSSETIRQACAGTTDSTR